MRHSISPGQTAIRRAAAAQCIGSRAVLLGLLVGLGGCSHFFPDGLASGFGGAKPEKPAADVVVAPFGSVPVAPPTAPSPAPVASATGTSASGTTSSPTLTQTTAPVSAPSKIDGFGNLAAVQPVSTNAAFAPALTPTEGTVDVTTAGSLTRHTVTPEGDDADITLSPDATWMAFTSTRHSPRSKLYLQRVDGTSVIQLTADDADDAHPVFSPDGSRIAFASNRSGQWKLYLMDISAKSTVQLTDDNSSGGSARGGGGHDMHPTFSPDGQWLAYSSLSARTGQWELWVMRLSSSQKMMIGPGLFPSWSPDRSVNRIAFQKARQRGSRAFSIWTLDLVDGEARNITEVAVSGNSALINPGWSPDGSALIFTEVPAGSAAPATGTAGFGVTPPNTTFAANGHKLWMVMADGSARKQLVAGTGVAHSPAWASSDRIFFISDKAGTENVWSIFAGEEPSSVVNVPQRSATADSAGD